MPDLKVSIIHSTSHTVFPKIVLGILIFLGIILVIQGLLKARQANRRFISLKDRRFFVDGHDRTKLLGTLIGLVLYIVLMPILGFIPASILFMLYFNVLYSARWSKKDLAAHLAVAAVETMSVWFVFGYLFEITLP